ncbi:hypothetical protein V865_007032 [Kwoniella europaea PYCC6329]|uniref:Uncharacterized protein n=1 Tax=Kwoniella europaea PYCC6329 TaxID=1423913 RepID=A0AAX4KUD1_9TREE
MIPLSPVVNSTSTSISFSPEPSPRPSISCLSGPPLTPIYEMDKISSDLIVSTTEEVEDGNGVVIPNDDDRTKNVKNARANLPTLTVPPPSFSNYSFGGSSPSASSSESSVGRTPSPLSSVDDIALPSEGFKFGTCPSTSFVGTPTAEQGPFEYPSSSSSTMSVSPPAGSPTLARRGSLALGMTHRRGSIIPPHSNNTSNSSALSPPPTRRSSTCSTITTLPAAGRRPSIVHSATVEVALPQTSGSTDESYQPTTSASSSRRPSVLMFPSKPLPAPIPPSLLARRGSLPVDKLFGIPLSSEQLNGGRIRASYSSGSATISTASLYLRRQSVVSESGFSNGSGATVMNDEGNGHSNSIRRPSMRTRTPSADFTPQTASSARRGSVSFFPPPQPSQLNTNSPVRSSSLSSRSSASSQRSSISSSRIPINFSPRHPNYAYLSSRQSSTTSLTPSTHSSSSTSASVPCSPVVGYNLRRNRNSTVNSNPGLSSSGEEDEHEEDNQLLPTPNPSKFSNTVPQAGIPTFVDPWSSSSSIDSKLSDMSVEEKSFSSGSSSSMVPLETPPLETVVERPPLESVDSGATERP